MLLLQFRPKRKTELIVASRTPPPFSAFLAPRHWPTWIGILLLCLIAWLPFRIRMAAGSLLGTLSFLLARERRYITGINIRLCFPELDPPAQARLVKQVFIENGIGLIETATGWVRKPSAFTGMVEFRGKELVAAAMAQGRGVLLQGGHFSTLDFSANLLSLFIPFAVTYRAHGNPLFNAFMLRGRLRNCNGVFDRRDIRGAFRHLKQGKALWYAPDQDYGPAQSVYAPFFGQRAACITAGSRFAAVNDSPVFIVSHRRDTRFKRYVLDAIPVPAEYPSGDDVADVTLINRMLEREVRKAPAQYMWMHKRFKTQPGGKPESPYIHIRTRHRTLDPDRFRSLIHSSTKLNDSASRLLLKSGLQLWLFPGLASGFGKPRHPALRLDSISRHLRGNGIRTVTVDSLFRIPHLDSTVLTLHVPAGEPASQTCNIPPEAAAAFLCTLHRCGCSFLRLSGAELHSDGEHLAIVEPLTLRCLPGTTAFDYRLEDLRMVKRLFNYSPEQTGVMTAAWLEGSLATERRALQEKLAAAPDLSHNATTASSRESSNVQHR